MAIYVVMTLGCFLVVLQMRGPDGEPIETISSLSGMSRTRPGLALALAIFMFSLAGIPPLLGFFANPLYVISETWLSTLSGLSDGSCPLLGPPSARVKVDSRDST